MKVKINPAAHGIVKCMSRPNESLAITINKAEKLREVLLQLNYKLYDKLYVPHKFRVYTLSSEAKSQDLVKEILRKFGTVPHSIQLFPYKKDYP